MRLERFGCPVTFLKYKSNLRSPGHRTTSQVPAHTPPRQRHQGLIRAGCQFINNSMHVCPETRADRVHLEANLYCGIPNATTVDDVEVEQRARAGRFKRVVGGVPANPVSQGRTCPSVPPCSQSHSVFQLSEDRQWSSNGNLSLLCRLRSSGRSLWWRTGRSTVEALISEDAG